MLPENHHSRPTRDTSGQATMLRCWLDEIGAAPEEIVSIVVAVNEAWQNAIEPGDRDRGRGMELKGGLMEDTRLGHGSHRPPGQADGADA